jgi:hypothetical protein
VTRSDHPLRGDLIKRYLPGEIPDRKDMTMLLWCDPGGARGTGHWAMSVVGFTRDAATDEVHLWILETVKAGTTTVKAAKEFCRLWWKWMPDACGCENTGFSQAFIDDTLKPQMRRESIPMRLTETKPGSIEKSRRVNGIENSLGTMFERGVAHAPRDDVRWWQEISMFPSGTYDVLDCTAAALKFAYGDKGHGDWFPRAVRTKPVTQTSDYQRLVQDAERIIKDTRRKELAHAGLGGGEPVVSEALCKIFRDGRPKREVVSA